MLLAFPDFLNLNNQGQPPEVPIANDYGLAVVACAAFICLGILIVSLVTELRDAQGPIRGCRGTCRTCKHWYVDTTDSYAENVIYQVKDGLDCSDTRDLNEDEITRKLGHAVKHCNNPKLLFFDRPESDGMAVIDGDYYHASLLTAEGFGCSLHEPIDGDD